jgi:hypothetical protein
MRNRLPRIASGYFLAILTPSALALLLAIGAALFSSGNEPVLPWALAGAVVLILASVIYLTPGILIIIIVSENFSLDRWIWHALALGAVFAATLFFFGPNVGDYLYQDTALAFTAGCLSGLVYWRVVWFAEEG